jgi:hypothetical protein
MRALLALLAVVLALLLAGQAEARPHGHGPQAEASQSDDCGAASKACVLHVLHCAAMPALTGVQPAGPAQVVRASPTAPRGLLPGRRDPPQPRPPLLSA